MGWVVNATPRPLYPQERPGTHCTGSWTGAENLAPTGIRSPELLPFILHKKGSLNIVQVRSDTYVAAHTQTHGRLNNKYGTFTL
jgi:hypothetical protein